MPFKLNIFNKNISCRKMHCKLMETHSSSAEVTHHASPPNELFIKFKLFSPSLSPLHRRKQLPAQPLAQPKQLEPLEQRSFDAPVRNRRLRVRAGLTDGDATPPAAAIPSSPPPPSSNAAAASTIPAAPVQLVVVVVRRKWPTTAAQTKQGQVGQQRPADGGLTAARRRPSRRRRQLSQDHNHQDL